MSAVAEKVFEVAEPEPQEKPELYGSQKLNKRKKTCEELRNEIPRQ